MQNQQDNSLVPAKRYLPALPQHRDSAIQIFQTSSDVSTPEKLAAVIADPSIARYKDLPANTRQRWIGSQIYALCLILHYQEPNPDDVKLDCAFADQMIMDDEGIQCLKQVEMQEAFRRGIANEYGKFYGITASSLVNFLKAYRTSEKRATAISILNSQEQQKRKAEDELFWKTLAEAKAEGKIELPEFPHSPFEDDKQHAERLARQREEIINAQNHLFSYEKK